jgi:sugar lactone lactonase YvrE
MRILPLLLTSLLGCTLLAAPRHAVLLREAAVALQANDTATALTKLEEAARLRPDYPRIQINLARINTAFGHADAALAALQRLADMGLQMNVAADPAYASLQGLPAFQAVAARLAAGPPATSVSDAATTVLAEVTGIIESCLLDPVTQAWYFSDVRNRCIWRRDAGPAGTALRKFTHDADDLDGIFKIALSADRKTLWATTATVGVMTGTDAEDGKRSALVAIDTTTGRVRGSYPVPADGHKHLLGDLVLSADGSIYATDSLSPAIWRLAPGGAALEPWLGNEDFLNLQGLALSSDGGMLYVTDYANGIWRINVATKQVALLTAPPNATFFGIDGLYAVPGGLLAVQNGVHPQRVLHIEPRAAGPSPTRLAAAGRPGMTDLALGQVCNGRFHFVGNSGWSLFDPVPATPPAPRPVMILSIKAD